MDKICHNCYLRCGVVCIKPPQKVIEFYETCEGWKPDYNQLESQLTAANQEIAELREAVKSYDDLIKIAILASDIVGIYEVHTYPEIESLPLIEEIEQIYNSIPKKIFCDYELRQRKQTFLQSK